jgi:iron complex outermembrane receptor protein
VAKGCDGRHGRSARHHTPSAVAGDPAAAAAASDAELAYDHRSAAAASSQEASSGAQQTGCSACCSGRTKLPVGDIPQSIAIVPKALVSEQGGTSVAAAVKDVSSINEGGSSSYGFFDRFLIRGMDARIYSDSFPDGDQFNGFPHSLNGVDHVEVLKGPGSALFGSTTPSGSINIVHFDPSPAPAYGVGLQVGSFGSISNTFYATGATSVPGLSYRIDGLLAHSDGFRELESANYEFRPVLPS